MRDDFELIFSDIQMPKMDGISAIALLKAAGVDTPCVALTANTMAHEVQRYLAAGFISHLAKPVDRSQFAAVLQQFFPNLPAKPQLQLPAAELAEREDDEYRGDPADQACVLAHHDNAGKTR